jgi:hypothetical protein
MANISSCAYRSRLAQRAQARTGPMGFHHNPGDFSGIAEVGARISTSQCLLRKYWDFLPAFKLRAARIRSTEMVSLAEARKVDQEMLARD